MTELERYISAVMKQPSKEARRAALETVPRHLRQRVELEVRERWKRAKSRG